MDGAHSARTGLLSLSARGSEQQQAVRVDGGTVLVGV